ncbi:hypothetical protein Ahy_B05g076343 [Arachis hypogaea]|uniref:Uncharacterized protein n=1 Tax=Arachis hypogaea TaxID=3818 RepID=A0A444Z3H4_ARAHY|nr:hypothetical protein Ahy_B05g076343 [Arachis hypogaea]
MLKQHKELSMSVHRTIENNKEAGIRPSKTYQSFVAAVEGHRKCEKLHHEKVRSVSELEDAKEFEKYLLRMKEKNQNFFFELELEDDQSIKLAFWENARSKAAYEYFGDVISFDTTYNTNRHPENGSLWLDFVLDHRRTGRHVQLHQFGTHTDLLRAGVLV